MQGAPVAAKVSISRPNRANDVVEGGQRPSDPAGQGELQFTPNLSELTK